MRRTTTIRGSNGSAHPEPESQSGRPDQVEILGSVGPIRIRSELAYRVRVHPSLHQPEQLASPIRPLKNSFQREQGSLNGQQPEQNPEPR